MDFDRLVSIIKSVLIIVLVGGIITISVLYVAELKTYNVNDNIVIQKTNDEYEQQIQIMQNDLNGYTVRQDLLTSERDMLFNENSELIDKIQNLEDDKKFLNLIVDELEEQLKENEQIFSTPVKMKVYKTYSQLVEFIKYDKTNYKIYDEFNFNCINYSAELIKNAEESSFICGFVAIDYVDSAHAIVAFDINDVVYYIEPQSDEFVNLKVGEHYHECVIPEEGYYYEEPDYDDIIQRYLVIW